MTRERTKPEEEPNTDGIPPEEPDENKESSKAGTKSDKEESSEEVAKSDNLPHKELVENDSSGM